MGRTGAAMIVAAALLGAGAAAALMWYRMTAQGFDYTRESWLLIVPVWGAIVAALLLATRWPLAGGVALMLTAFMASWYFADVFGYLPGGVAFAAGMELTLRSAFAREAGGAETGEAA